jgi:hypothetical protein
MSKARSQNQPTERLHCNLRPKLPFRAQRKSSIDFRAPKLLGP